MTYDMRIVGEGEPYAEGAVQQALANLTAASRSDFRARTDRERRAAARAKVHARIELIKADPNEFELNASGMTTAKVVMSRLGMLDHDTKHDLWPNQADYGVTPAMAQLGPEDDEPRELAYFRAAEDAVRDKQAENPTGIPLYKLGTNDNWLVTRDEITAALGAYRTALGDGASDCELWWWPYWIEFIERAAKHGGFRVH